MYVHGTPDSRLARHPDDGVAERLGVRLVAVDRPGFGHSSFDPAGTVGSFADDGPCWPTGSGSTGSRCWPGRRGRCSAWRARPGTRTGSPGWWWRPGCRPFAAYAEPGVLDGAGPPRRLFAELGAEVEPVALGEELAPFLVPDPPTLEAAREQVLGSVEPRVPGAVEQLAAALVDSVRGGRAGLAHDLTLQASPPDIDLEAVRCRVELCYGIDDSVAPPSFGHWYAEHLPDAGLGLFDGGHGFPLVEWPYLLDRATSPAPRPRPGPRFRCG